MTCIKTGARVFLENYNCTIPADLYRVGSAIVIRGNPECIEHANRLPGAPRTHSAFLPDSDCYINKATGIIVVPASCVLETP